jgi:hypothetical protein
MNEKQDPLAVTKEEATGETQAVPMLDELRAMKQALDAALAQSRASDGDTGDLIPTWIALEKIRLELEGSISLVNQVHHLCTVATKLNGFIENFGPKAATRQAAQAILDCYVAVMARCGIALVGGHALVGEAFDPRIHQRIATAPVTKKHPQGTVVSAPLFGARIGERVLIYPNVIVADDHHHE